ncbi:MAG TPA: tripartite tricarboxylate transporter substrate binding protein [Quisquiliibacterium sp.]|nr:tripartite tricarboxylate transporter substrate binding protein [Quisquiliibacterium sp.]HPA90126.1 tripartite tricarboxylate transporter substrate binding protein [Quisquiliibacterium sp.]HQD82210.1 tripartite tricarboxylate transporter substrate binding protein [Quisquiliibacterium sp.]HQN14377.1 tripartite tricarboxylate transporter substrate binding protein [Quisquiliibacterium sp.]HQP66550.1 tripartite tricarboxylate transporter substrate binding protein [Quisquiliibacterium sp.]
MSRPMRTVRRTLMSAALALLAAGAAVPAHAQAYPTKPIKIVVGFPAGSATDVIARVVAEHLRAKLGQPVIVENRPGANAVLGVSEVARAPADGYTILATNSSSMTANHQIYKKIPYLPERDFAPVTMVVSAPFIMTVNAANERTASVNTLADLVALAKAKPGQLSYSSGGPGNLAHLGMEMFNNRAGIKTNHVPYKGGVAAQTGLLGKEVDTQMDTPTAAPHVRAGKLKALAVTTAKRWPDLPEVPTLAESGYPGFDVSFWLGILVPAQTPPAIVQTLYNAIRTLRDDPNAMRTLQQQGTVELTSPQDFAARIRSETTAWGEVIRRENIQLD